LCWYQTGRPIRYDAVLKAARCVTRLQMHKLLIALPVAASLVGCSTWTDDRGRDPITRALDEAPLIYRPTIQQGNVVTQEAVNQLQPGMTKRQVRYALGTPMLVDVFHQDRWDFVYTQGVGSTPDETERVTLFFEDDRLVRISGDLRPQPAAEQSEERQEVVVSVPDWDGDDGTLLRRALRGIGLDD
jgi:outer membrane protein assembly factor BamE